MECSLLWFVISVHSMFLICLIITWVIWFLHVLENWVIICVLDLRNNTFHGTIPETFAKNFRSLNLNGNQLEGPLPQSLVNCKHLEVLDLGNTKINNTFPHWLGTFPNLWVLVLRSNRFHGPIENPSTKVSFTNLRIIDLDHNEFHGLLPEKYFNYLNAMMNANAD